MYSIEQSAGQVIAADTQASVAAIDQAVLSYARLCASIVEVSQSAQLPVSASQPALNKMSAALVSVVEGRELVSGATRELLKVRRNSTLRTVGFGCPPELPSRPSALRETALADE